MGNLFEIQRLLVLICCCCLFDLNKSTNSSPIEKVKLNFIFETNNSEGKPSLFQVISNPPTVKDLILEISGMQDHPKIVWILKKNSFIAGMDTLVHSNKGSKSLKVVDDCFYHGILQETNGISRNNWVYGSTCNGGFEGSFLIKGKIYNISPKLDGLHDSKQLETHVVSLEKESFFESDLIIKSSLNMADLKNSKENDNYSSEIVLPQKKELLMKKIFEDVNLTVSKSSKKFNILNQNTGFIIETLICVDKNAVGFTPLQEIQELVLKSVNIACLRLKTLDVTLRITKFVFFDPNPFSFSSASDAVNNFASWAQTNFNSYPHDAAMYYTPSLTRFGVAKVNLENCDSTVPTKPGTSNYLVFQRYKSSSTVNYDDAKNIAVVGVTIAHEMAHVLGAKHDGEFENTACTSNTIMKDAYNHLYWEWSSCSINHIKTRLADSPCFLASSVINSATASGGCGVGSYSTSGGCAPCSSDCFFCSSSSFCNRCNDNMVLQDSKCVQECFNGYYEVSESSVPLGNSLVGRKCELCPQMGLTCNSTQIVVCDKTTGQNSVCGSASNYPPNFTLNNDEGAVIGGLIATFIVTVGVVCGIIYLKKSKFSRKSSTNISKQENRKLETKSSKQKTEQSKKVKEETLTIESPKAATVFYSKETKKTETSPDNVEKMLKPGFAEFIDQESGAKYFYNEETGESTWERPVIS